MPWGIHGVIAEPVFFRPMFPGGTLQRIQGGKALVEESRRAITSPLVRSPLLLAWISAQNSEHFLMTRRFGLRSNLRISSRHIELRRID